MSISTSVTAPVHLCRKLFGEPVSCIRIQQTLETIMRKDLDRFQNKWNFQLANNLPENKNRKPLSLLQLHSGNLQKHGANEFILEPILSAPSFYTRSPRKLKAFRRLPLSVAQKTHMELFRKTTGSEVKEYPYTFAMSHSSPDNDALNDNQKPAASTPLSTDTATIVPYQPSKSSTTPCQISSSSSSSSVVPKPSTVHMTPIVIRSSGSSNHNALSSSSNPPRHSVKLIRSDRLSLKKSGPKVTGNSITLPI
ncbi:unnamed protein product [Heterobilharzia americana]|nr:unnamed protein product [Heterobilharzia americana]